MVPKAKFEKHKKVIRDIFLIFMIFKYNALLSRAGLEH
jgi:hypothetical protein